MDPVTFAGSGRQPGMFNRYSYTFNDPMNNIDPDGECAFSMAVRANNGAGDFCRGFVEGATGTYTAWKLSHGIKRGDPRSLFIANGMSVGAQIAINNPSKATKLAADSLAMNKARITGRVAGGTAVSLAGSKAIKKGLEKLGAGRSTKKAAGASFGAANFSSGQIASATLALGGLYDSISEAGYNPGNLSVGAVGSAALVSAAGGEISFDSKTGAVTATLPARTGSRIPERVKLNKIEK